MSVTELVKAPSPNHIRTYTGGWINPVDPDPDAILLEDIAHSLSNQCRFTGHVRKFYSVAQHSVLVANYLYVRSDAKEAWAGLLHDASEAYVSDLARPVKRNEAISAAYDAIENNLMSVIAEKFDFEWPMGKLVKHADDVLLRTEQRDLMLGATYEGEMLDEVIEPWSPEAAEVMFRDATIEYSLLRGMSKKTASR